MGLIDPELWHNRNNDAAALASEFAGPKGREWLMRWLPARAHDNGIFLVFANGIGLDDNEVRTGNAMILDPYGRILAESRSIGDDIVIRVGRGAVVIYVRRRCVIIRLLRGFRVLRCLRTNRVRLRCIIGSWSCSHGRLRIL